MVTTLGVILGSLPGIVVGLLVAWAIGRNLKARATGKPLPNPITFNPGEFTKAVLAAFTGNADAMRIAFDKSIDIHWKQGDRLSWMMDAVLDEIASNIKNPSFPMPGLDALAHWTGLPRDVLFVMGENELRSRKILPAPVPAPAPAPAAAVVAAGLLLCLCVPTSAGAVTPIGPNFYAWPSHWNAQVHAPQRFYPTEFNLIAEPKPAPEQPAKQVAFRVIDEYGNVIHEQVATGVAYAPDGTPCGPQSRPVYYANQPRGFIPRVSRVAFAPFRFAFRPLRRLFGRC